MVLVKANWNLKKVSRYCEPWCWQYVKGLQDVHGANEFISVAFDTLEKLSKFPLFQNRCKALFCLIVVENSQLLLKHTHTMFQNVMLKGTIMSHYFLNFFHSIRRNIKEN
jgi:hypothetical protein